MNISFSSKSVLPNPCKILELYLLIYIEHKETIMFWSNRLTKTIEKMEPWAHSKLILNHLINDP